MAALGGEPATPIGDAEGASCATDALEAECSGGGAAAWEATP